VFEVGLVLAGTPPCWCPAVIELGLGVVGHIFQQNLPDGGLGLFDGEIGRQANAEPELNARVKDVSCANYIGNSGLSSDCDSGRPAFLEEAVEGIQRDGAHSLDKRELLVDFWSCVGCQLFCLFIARWRNVGF
jgi:hypothetical protein